MFESCRGCFIAPSMPVRIPRPPEADVSDDRIRQPSRTETVCKPDRPVAPFDDHISPARRAGPAMQPPGRPDRQRVNHNPDAHQHDLVHGIAADVQIAKVNAPTGANGNDRVCRLAYSLLFDNSSHDTPVFSQPYQEVINGRPETPNLAIWRGFSRHGRVRNTSGKAFQGCAHS